MKTLMLFALISTLLFSGPLNSKNFGNAIVSEVTSIYDGDTFRVNIKDYPAIVGEHISIRINGIDTPELKGRCQKEKELARAAKRMTVTALRNAKNDRVEKYETGEVFPDHCRC